jgi:transcriptional regulator of acetoin/glycerol metabolism
MRGRLRLVTTPPPPRRPEPPPPTTAEDLARRRRLSAAALAREEARLAKREARQRRDAGQAAEMVRALEAAGGNMSAAARALGLTRAGIYVRMRRLGLR